MHPTRGTQALIKLHRAGGRVMPALDRFLMTEAMQTLIAAIQAGFLTGEPWVAWAERALLESTSPPPGLVELYDAETPERAMAARSQGLNKSERQLLPLDQTGLQLGFLYLRHLEGRASVATFLYEAGQVADARNYNNPSCESIYSLLNEYEGRGRTKAYEPDTFTAKVAALFSGHAALAKGQLFSLRGTI